MTTFPTLMTAFQACVIGMVLAAVFMTSRMRVSSLVFWYAAQSLLLAVAVALFGLRTGDTSAFVIAFVIALLKGFIIPRWFVRTLRAEGAIERLSALVRPTTLVFLALAAVLGAGILAHSLTMIQAPYSALTSSIALLLLGFLMLVTRKDMVGLAFGFLVFENGVFTLGLTLTGGMPLFVELGILFDLLVFFTLLLALARRAQKEHASLATEYLQELIG